MKNMRNFRNIAEVFDKHPADVTKNDIEHADEEAFLHLFKDEKSHTFHNFRVDKFAEKVVKSFTFVDPRGFPNHPKQQEITPTR